MYEVHLSRRANSYYQRTDRKVARRLDQCFEALGERPLGSGNAIPIRGRAGTCRYIVGGLRVIFTVDHRERIVTVIDIGPRGDVY